jgi:hypothetical protein
MVRDAFYASRDFWAGASIGLTLLALTVLFLAAKRYLTTTIRARIAERVARDFVLANEIFDLLRVNGAPHEQRDEDFFEQLQARVEAHSGFFQNLLDERQRFCFFFGQTFDIAFADVLATYNDVVTGCEMLHLYRGSLQQNDVEALGPHKRLVPIVFKHEDPAQDVTRFRLLRAMALVDSVYAPVVAERERRKARAAARDAMDAVTAH